MKFVTSDFNIYVTVQLLSRHKHYTDPLFYRLTTWKLSIGNYAWLILKFYVHNKTSALMALVVLFFFFVYKVIPVSPRKWFPKFEQNVFLSIHSILQYWSFIEVTRKTWRLSKMLFRMHSDCEEKCGKSISN